MIPKAKMVKNNTTLAELGTIETDYPIRLRLKYFEVVHKDGSTHVRGRCLSLQQFTPSGHFVSAISIREEELHKLINGLTEVQL